MAILYHVSYNIHILCNESQDKQWDEKCQPWLDPGCCYWCHASDSLTEPSGPAASQHVHIPISLCYELKFSQDCHRTIPSHSHFSHFNSLTETGIAIRLGTWQLYSCLGSYFTVGTGLKHLKKKLSFLV